jgi:CO/xanthine dehydrogenase Mo-binding subunit
MTLPTLAPPSRHAIRLGTGTLLAQVAASALGVPLEDVRVHIADTRLPRPASQRRSRTLSSPSLRATSIPTCWP